VPPKRLKPKLIEIAAQFEETRQRLVSYDPDGGVAIAKALLLLDDGNFASARAVLAAGRKNMRYQTARKEALLAIEEARIAILELHHDTAVNL